MKIFLLMILGCAAVFSLAGEYFVNPDGDDRNDGKERSRAFRTVKRGIEAMRNGDTLTIGPGEYFESLEIKLPGSDSAITTVRAEIPGTVVIRGDRTAPVFTKFKEGRFIWVCEWNDNVETVNERDTLTIYREAGSREELDYTRGSWFHDRNAGKLYIATSDGEPPSVHFLTVSVLRGHGMLFPIPKEGYSRNFVIDGLTFTGFNCREAAAGAGGKLKWGVYITRAEKCVISNCTAFLNGSGLALGRPVGSSIENCRAYGNGSHFNSSGGNIIMWGPAKDSTVRRCIAWSTNYGGIRFYGGTLKNCHIEDCIAWDCRGDGIAIKPPDKSSSISGSAVIGSLNTLTSRNNVYESNAYLKTDPSSMKLGPGLDLRSEIVSPANLDYRRLPGTTCGGGLEIADNTYFLSPDGNDLNDGKSPRSSWRTLQRVPADSMVYLSPGKYPGGFRISSPNVTVRSRDARQAVIDGGESGIVSEASGTVVDNICFINQTVAGIQANGGAVVSRCSFGNIPLGIAGGSGFLTVSHNVFAETVKNPVNPGSGAGILTANIFAVPPAAAAALKLSGNEDRIMPEFTDAANGDFRLVNQHLFNGKSPDGLPLGPYDYIRKTTELKFYEPNPLKITSRTAHIEWWTNVADATTELRYGTTPDCRISAGSPFSVSSYHTVSLSGLKPDTRYYYRLSSFHPPYEHHSDISLAAADRVRKRERHTSEVFEFKTPASDREAKEWYVATDGDNGADGSGNNPWKTIQHAVRSALPGDRILVRGGIYRESVIVPVGGLSIRNVPGEKVCIDGGKGKSAFGFKIDNKQDIRIEGFYLRNFSDTATGGGIVINGGENISVERCFYDGRSNGYTPAFINAQGTKKLTMRNCVVVDGFRGANFMKCPELLIENNVFYINQVRVFNTHNAVNEKIRFTHNIIVDLVPTKVMNSLFSVLALESFEESWNCYYLRLPEEQRKLVYIARAEGESFHKDVTYGDFLRYSGRTATSFFADPQMPVVSGLIRFADEADWRKRFADTADDHAKMERKKRGGEFQELDFSDFFPRNTACRRAGDGKPIGLDPQKFSGEEKENIIKQGEND